MSKMFNSKVYLKMSVIERPQQEKVDKLTEDLKLAKEKYGKKSDMVWDLQKELRIEKRVLETIWQCKNTLY